MREIFFCVKTLILTVFIVIALQIQVGSKTIESHALGWMQSSVIVTPLNAAARGAAKLFLDMKARARDKVKRQFSGWI